MNFEETFQVWLYSPGGGQLLLRSKKKSEEDKRIDILFSSVDAACIRFHNIRELTIFEVERSELADRQPDLVQFSHPELRAFVVESSEWSGYVIAGSVEWADDHLGAAAPSSLELNLDISVIRHLF